jgi:hypothetical protein
VAETSQTTIAAACSLKKERRNEKQGNERIPLSLVILHMWEVGFFYVSFLFQAARNFISAFSLFVESERVSQRRFFFFPRKELSRASK